MIASFKKIFFENIGIRQTVIKNTFWLGLAEGISRLLEFVLVVYIIRVLGVTEFGKFTFALAFVSMFIVIFDLGLFNTITRELSYDKEAQKDYPAILSLKLVLNIVTFVLILAVSFLVTREVSTRSIIWILGLFVLINDFFSVIYAFIRSRQKMEFEAAAKIIRSFILVSVVFFVVATIPSLKNISYGYVFANILALAVVLSFFHFKIHYLKFHFSKDIWKKFLKISWPLGLAAIFGAMIISMDSIMMGYLGQTTENGWYNASQKIMSAVITMATLISMSFYPLLSKFFNESKEKLQRAWNYYLESMIIIAVPMMVGGFFLASQIITFIFGQGFEPSIIVFQMLVFVAGINFICYPYIIILIASCQQKKYVWINFTAAVVNILLNVILIPRYSLYGAAASSVITYFILLLLSVEFSRRFTDVSIFNFRILKISMLSIAASFMMIILVYQSLVYGDNILFGILLGIILYSVIMFSSYNLLKRISLL